MQHELNKTYHFNIPTENLRFGDLSGEECVELFRDGRVAAPFFERQIPKWFPALTFVDKKGYDHVDLDGRCYDAKGFTNGGCKFMPSRMLGVGRTFDQEEAQGHAEELIYIIHEIIDFPKVRVIFKRGSDLVKDFPKCSIPKGKREVLFAE